MINRIFACIVRRFFPLLGNKFSSVSTRFPTPVLPVWFFALTLSFHGASLFLVLETTLDAKHPPLLVFLFFLSLFPSPLRSPGSVERFSSLFYFVRRFPMHFSSLRCIVLLICGEPQYGLLQRNIVHLTIYKPNSSLLFFLSPLPLFCLLFFPPFSFSFSRAKRVLLSVLIPSRKFASAAFEKENERKVRLLFSREGIILEIFRLHSLKCQSYFLYSDWKVSKLRGANTTYRGAFCSVLLIRIMVNDKRSYFMRHKSAASSRVPWTFTSSSTYLGSGGLNSGGFRSFDFFANRRWIN